MSGKTPNFLKPLGSTSKVLKPRSQNRSAKKQDVNCTVMGSESVSCFGSTSSRNLNSTVRRNLDVTLARPGPPQFKAKFTPSEVDHDLLLSLDYNNYLQAVLKEEIVKKTTEKHISTLDNQIILQCENLYKLQQNYEETKNKIENLKDQCEIVEILDLLSDSINNLNAVFNKLDTFKSVVSLCDTLTEESNLLKLNNIKPIETQEEYDQLINQVSGLVITLDKVLNSGRNFSGISKLGEEITRFNDLKKEVEEFQKKIDVGRKKISVALIHNASDMFASLGHYDKEA